ncbi:MAG: L-lactate dehydrogenase [Bacillota bacterium]|nr:L-lactate dehydrogenase [Bacillota bacterium]
MNKNTKISVIGAGFVGATTAYALMNAGLASEIVIVDINKEKAEGEAMDISHGVSFVKPVDVKAGDYEDTKDSDIVIITAGAAQKPGETRLELINKNYKIFSSIVPNIVKYSPNSILLVVSNPVDVLSYITFKLSGFPKERVIGSGTVLDTSRLRYLLSQHFQIDVRNVHTYIMGEHGDSEIATWSLTNIAGMSVNEYCSLICSKCDGSLKLKIHEDVKNAAYEVISKKGATYFAVALAVKRIVEAILRDENSILTVSTLLEGQYGIDNIYMGVPSIVGSSGVKSILEVPLDKSELDELQKSAATLKDNLKSI